MYDMIKGDQDVGRVLSGELHSESPGFGKFLDQFDLNNG